MIKVLLKRESRVDENTQVLDTIDSLQSLPVYRVVEMHWRAQTADGDGNTLINTNG